MNHNWLKYFWFLCVAGLILPVQAQLEFVQVTNANLPNFNLLGVTCGGAANSVFVAVGAGAPVLTWTLTNSGAGTNQNMNWVSVSNGLPGNNYLDAVTFGTNQLGANQFVVSGSNNVVFSSTDAMRWTNNGKAFSDSYTAKGLAFNNGTFVIVSRAPEISWSTDIASTPWNSATIINKSPFDSYNGVTAFNSTNWVACGDYGTLAISTNGVQNWTEPYGAFVSSNLLGIAWDGHQTVVCVGGNEEILAFTNGGPFGGPPSSSNSWGRGNLNAVSYVGTNYLGTNYGFIAVGANGSVLTSADGANWTTNSATDPTLKANTNSLNGVFFATSGQFKGIGVLVGDRGTIILAGTPPPPPVNPMGATNCATYPNPANNNPLSVTLVTDADPPGTVTVDWYDTNGNRVATSTTNYVPTNNPDLVGSNLPAIYTYYAEERDLRTSFTSTNVSVKLTIYPRPTATVSGSANICNGQPATIQAALTGTGPWTATWLETWPGGSATFTNTYSTTNANLTVPTNSLPLTNSLPNQTTSYTFTITNLTDSSPSGCGALPSDLNGNAVLTVYPLPTATLLSTNLPGYIFAATNCNNGTSYRITNILTGIGPWVVTWDDDYRQTNMAAVSGPTNLIRTVYPTNSFAGDTPSNNVYYITSLQATNTCEASDILGTNTIVVNPLPTGVPVSKGDQTNCVGVANPPLTVTDANSVIWYDTNGNVVASDTNSFTPTNSAPGVWTYYAAEINASGCTNGMVTPVGLVLLACTNPPTIQLSGTNGTIQWFGNLTLQSTTNLATPDWMDVTNGSMGTNTWNWTNGIPPINFFRLNTN